MTDKNFTGEGGECHFSDQKWQVARQSWGEESFLPMSKSLCFDGSLGDPSTDSMSWERAARTT